MARRTLSLLLLVLTLFAAANAYGPATGKPRGDFKGAAALTTDFHGDRWQHQTAATKQAAVWAAIVADLTPGSWPSVVEKLELFTEQMNLTFDVISDQFLFNEFNIWPYNFSTIRQKIIHSVGATAKCQWVSKGNHPYTGLFQGANNGLVRFSWAGKPDPSAQYPYPPGIGLKFFRDYISSTNFMAMYSLEGQTVANFFAHDLTNHVPDISNSAPFALQQLKKVFHKASDWPTMLGLSDFASFTENGDPVSSPRFPFRLVFHPTLQYHTMFPNTTDEDLPSQLSENMLPNSIVFYIYAQDTSTSTSLQEIGYLYLSSETTSSKFADESMYLQHVRMEDDFAIRPDWIQGAVAILQEQESVDHWTFPDLPFDQ